MRKLFLLLFIFPTVLLAQLPPGTIDAIYYFERPTFVKLNEAIVNYFRDNLDRIESYQGKTVVNIPYEKHYLPKRKTVFVNGLPYQYQVAGTNIIVLPLQCRVAEFDFVKKTFKTKTMANDNNDDLKPGNLKDLIKQKDDNHAKFKKKPKLIKSTHIGRK